MEFQEFPRYTAVTKEHGAYLKALRAFVEKSQHLPKYHLYPKSGLMNDPNGLSYFNGAYHFFYQWFPLDASHGMKHWGLYTSKDLAHWEDRGLALTPDQPYEKNGCYSGNAIEKDGQLYLFYTANYKTPEGKVPKQAVAVMAPDGSIQKYQGNPIIDGAPEGMSGEIRDPFVFEKAGTYWMLLGAKDLSHVGQLLLYQSDDLFNWHYEGTIALDVPKGYMLECPSLIEVDGKSVLLLSPMGYEKEANRYHNQFASVYLTGELDLVGRTFKTERLDEIDGGFDFYAPQAFYGAQGQPLMVGWFGCGEQELPTDADKWRHGLTMPYELSLHEGRLRHYPVAEVQQQFGPAESFSAQTITAKNAYYHLHFSGNESQTVLIGHDRDAFAIKLDAENKKAIFDRQLLKERVTPCDGEVRQMDLPKGDEVTVDIFVDNSFIEVFFNQGEQSFCARVFNLKNKSHQISFSQETEGSLAYFKA